MEIWKGSQSHNTVVNNEENEEDKPTTDQLIKEAYEMIMSDYSIVSLRENNQMYYWKDGVYLPNGDILIAERAEHLIPRISRNEKTGSSQELTTAMSLEIKNHIMRRTYRNLEEFDADPYIQNVKNGLYNVMTGEFKAHDNNSRSSYNPPYLSMNQKPIIYDPKARPKLLGKFLKEVLYPKDIRVLVEIMAYTFYPDNPYENHHHIAWRWVQWQECFI